MQSIKKTTWAFTLAEVLITLGIIGIVAAMTIPTLIANYQKTQYVTGLKKAYAEVTEALKLMANDKGCPDDLRCIFDKNTPELGSEFAKYFKLAKDCGFSNFANEETRCFSDYYHSYYDGSDPENDMSPIMSGKYSFITADGFSMSFYSWGDKCTNGGYPLHPGPDYNTSQVCGDILIDVNGFKGPNNFGRDIYEFSITNGKGPALYPQGGYEQALDNYYYWRTSPYGCGNNSTPYGGACTGRIMEEGWQMKY